MLGINGMKTKKELKEMKGEDVRPFIVETSMFGNEYVPTGKLTVAHDPHGKRDWFAQITVEDNIITKVT